MELKGTVDAPILSVIAKEILAQIRNDAALRELWSKNAPQACYSEGGTLTNAAVQAISQAFPGNGETFYQLVIGFDVSAGPGNYRMDGINPTVTPGTGGMPIPSGGGVLVITGHENIRGFRMVAQSATTMPFFRMLFK